jgi:hypothetical protein
LRHVRERQAGCWPTDLRVTAAAVEGTQPGIPDPPRSSTTRPTPPVPQPAPSCDPRAGQGSQAGPVKQTRPAGKPCREPHSTPLPTPRPARPNHGYRTAHRCPRHARHDRTTAIAQQAYPATRYPTATARQPRTGPASQHPPARETARPGPGRRTPNQNSPARPAATRHVHNPRPVTNNPRPEHPERQSRRFLKMYSILAEIPDDTVGRSHPESSSPRHRHLGCEPSHRHERASEPFSIGRRPCPSGGPGRVRRWRAGRCARTRW